MTLRMRSACSGMDRRHRSDCPLAAFREECTATPPDVVDAALQLWDATGHVPSEMVFPGDRVLSLIAALADEEAEQALSIYAGAMLVELEDAFEAIDYLDEQVRKALRLVN